MSAVHLVFMTKSGQPGLPTVLTAPRWGFYDVCFGSNAFSLPVPFTSMVVENHFFKLVAAEGHGIAAIEAALTLSGQLHGRVHAIRTIRLRTQEAAMAIINKTGPLHNSADRDHCMQYMVAITLLKGDWPEAHDYDDDSTWANDPRVDELRSKITMEEDPQMTRDYHDLNVRKGASGLTATMQDGTVLDEVLVEWPVGHPWREDTIARVKAKFVKLSKPVLQDPEKIWNESMKEDFSDVKVRDWVDQFSSTGYLGSVTQ
jgi:2-methylcitrate dehydratase